MFPYLKGNDVHLVTLANEQCSCDGAINSAAHTEKDGRACHEFGIVPGRVDKGLEVYLPSFGSMGCQIMNILGWREGFIDPFMISHVTHTMEVSAILD